MYISAVVFSGDTRTVFITEIYRNTCMSQHRIHEINSTNILNLKKGTVFITVKFCFVFYHRKKSFFFTDLLLRATSRTDEKNFWQPNGSCGRLPITDLFLNCSPRPRMLFTDCIRSFRRDKWVHIRSRWFWRASLDVCVSSQEETDLLHGGNWSSADCSLHQKSIKAPWHKVH